MDNINKQIKDTTNKLMEEICTDTAKGKEDNKEEKKCKKEQKCK